MMHVRKWQVAESRLSAVDDGPECVGRRRIKIGSDGRRQKWQKTMGDVGVRWMMAEDNGRRWFDVLQSSRVAVCVCRLKHVFRGQVELMHINVYLT